MSWFATANRAELQLLIAGKPYPHVWKWLHLCFNPMPAVNILLRIYLPTQSHGTSIVESTLREVLLSTLDSALNLTWIILKVIWKFTPSDKIWYDSPHSDSVPWPPILPIILLPRYLKYIYLILAPIDCKNRFIFQFINFPIFFSHTKGSDLLTGEPGLPLPYAYMIIRYCSDIHLGF